NRGRDIRFINFRNALDVFWLVGVGRIRRKAIAKHEVSGLGVCGPIVRCRHQQAGAETANDRNYAISSFHDVDFKTACLDQQAAIRPAQSAASAPTMAMRSMFVAPGVPSGTPAAI